jgi:hypothetical protein
MRAPVQRENEMKKPRQRISLQRQWAPANDWPIAALRPLTFYSDTHELDVHTVHVFDEPRDATVAVVFETGAGSISVRLPRTLAGQLGDGLRSLVPSDGVLT